MNRDYLFHDDESAAFSFGTLAVWIVIGAGLLAVLFRVLLVARTRKAG